MNLDGPIAPFWQDYLASLSDPDWADRQFYETFCIGNTVTGANQGAALIVQGIKTATSSLLWEYEAEQKPLPQIGSLSILLNGNEEPVCVVETTHVAIQAFNDVDATFAYAYGEGDRSLEDWRLMCWDYYAKQCRELGKEPLPTMPLVCEWFQVVYLPP